MGAKDQSSDPSAPPLLEHSSAAAGEGAPDYESHSTTMNVEKNDADMVCSRLRQGATS